MSTHDGMTPASPAEREAWAAARAALASTVADPALSALPAALQRICRAVTTSLFLTGAVIQLLSDADRAVVLASSSAASQRLGEIPFTIGEGPSVDAFASARPVLAPNLMGEGQSQWPGYVSVMSDHGVGAVYAFPLHVGAVRLGVLELYDGQVRRLSSIELSLALVFAEAATDCLVDPPTGSSVALLGDLTLGVMDRRVEIHQAQGMVTVDLGVTLVEALALMRAHAFSRELTLLELSRMILAGERLPTPEGA